MAKVEIQPAVRELYRDAYRLAKNGYMKHNYGLRQTVETTRWQVREHFRKNLHLTDESVIRSKIFWGAEQVRVSSQCKAQNSWWSMMFPFTADASISDPNYERDRQRALDPNCDMEFRRKMVAKPLAPKLKSRNRALKEMHSDPVAAAMALHNLEGATFSTADVEASEQLLVDKAYTAEQYKAKQQRTLDVQKELAFIEVGGPEYVKAKAAAEIELKRDGNFGHLERDQLRQAALANMGVDVEAAYPEAAMNPDKALEQYVDADPVRQHLYISDEFQSLLNDPCRNPSIRGPADHVATLNAEDPAAGYESGDPLDAVSPIHGKAYFAKAYPLIAEEVAAGLVPDTNADYGVGALHAQLQSPSTPVHRLPLLRKQLRYAAGRPAAVAVAALEAALARAGWYPEYSAARAAPGADVAKLDADALGKVADLKKGLADLRLSVATPAIA